MTIPERAGIITHLEQIPAQELLFGCFPTAVIRINGSTAIFTVFQPTRSRLSQIAMEPVRFEPTFILITSISFLNRRWDPGVNISRAKLTVQATRLSERQMQWATFGRTHMIPMGDSPAPIFRQV